jgi:hypothetical protein
MTKLGRDDSLPWMWALNGAASVVAGFLAIIVSMEASITVSVLFGAGLYLVAAMLLPWDRAKLARTTLIAKGAYADSDPSKAVSIVAPPEV